MKIDFKTIEEKWKAHWAGSGVNRVTHRSNLPKYYVLDMFPYPSGTGLHVGHPLGYIASDILSRYKRMNGFNVLHPMGFDAFGLPAEQYAIQTGVHPAISTEENISNYRRQLLNLGFSYDWSREVRTSDPGFYQWTQWIFLQLYHHYYDTHQNIARPVADLIAHFERNGNTGIAAATAFEADFTAGDWVAMTPKQKDDILMNYRLAYRKVSYVNWCEALGTVLANDEVKDGLSERGGYPVERRAMLQWSLRITAYAERLLLGLENLDWSDAMKTVQANWIGRSEGARLDFSVIGSDARIRVFTTRPDTIYGATFMVLAPEHPLVQEITSSAQQAEAEAYITYTKSRSERDRIAMGKEMTGVFTGAFAENPFTGTEIQVWIADYVLMDYGTGAIMAVPGDDERDAAFAQKFGLPVVEVIDRPEGGTVGDRLGTMINSGIIDGMHVPEAVDRITEEIERMGIGRRAVQYKMRDAIYSRQRYWGEPVPVIYDADGVSYALSEDALPLELPPLDDFQPGGGVSPLARAKDWVNLPAGMHRDTDTMPGYAGSSWYFLRYMDPVNDEVFASRETLEYWRDVDLYIGGTEHATGHLMYARFWHKFLFDLGLVPTDEPFRRLINQGMIQGVIENITMYRERVDGYHRFLSAELSAELPDELFIRMPVPIEFVESYGSPDSWLSTEGIEKFIAWRPEYADAVFECANGVFHKGIFRAKNGADGSRLVTHSEIGKMGKRYHNAVNPDDVVEKYGADCFRMYEMFLGPVEQSKPWDTRNIDGVSRFIRKFWSLYIDDAGNLQLTDDSPSKEALHILHRTIKRVREDIDRFSLNTCISHFMTAVNELKKQGVQSREVLKPLLLLVAPFAPFLSEELWERTGRNTSIHTERYPQADPALAAENTITYPVCINGKKRAELPVDASIDQATLKTLALDLDEIKKWLDGKEVRKVIIVPGRMVNIVV